MRKIIEKAWDNRSLLKEKDTIENIKEVIKKLDNGENGGCVWARNSDGPN